MQQKRFAPVFIALLIVGAACVIGGGYLLYEKFTPSAEVLAVVTNFQECVDAGNPVMESYPRQCRHGDKAFTEDIGQVVGGDKDEHGCIGSAGYSWCERKDKCLRIWEEKCYASTEQEIQYYLAGKYDKAVGEVTVTIIKQTENHVAGSVKFGPASSAGGMFLAVRSGNMWEIVYDGNGSVDCEKMRSEYNFPEEVLLPNFCDATAPVVDSCVCPQGYVKEGEACNPSCYYNTPPCLAPSISCIR